MPTFDTRRFPQIEEIIKQDMTGPRLMRKVVGISCGLDYEGAHKDGQIKLMQKHFDVAEKFKLPLYFH